MTRSARARERSSGAALVRAADEAFGAVSSTVPVHEYWVSSAAVRQAIGAWAYTLGAGESRPGSEGVRAAIGVASAIRELALDDDHRRWSGEGGATLEVAVPADLAELASRTGLALRDVERALEILTAARVVTRQTGATTATVSLVAHALVPAPAVAHIAWAAARDRLRTVVASMAPALAVLRELSALAGAFDPAADSPTVRASVRDLEDATSFGRSTVSEALGALDRARLLDIETRAGRTTRFELRRAAFGLPDEAPPPQVFAGSRTGAAANSAALPHPRVEDRAASAQHDDHAVAGGRAAMTPPASVTGAAALVGTFAGTPIYAPPGTPLVLDRDAEGRWICRVGPLLVLGPVEPH